MAINPADFRAPYIPKEEIWNRVENFRDQYWPKRIIPVDVLDIAEFGLKLTFYPKRKLKQECDAEAALMGDLRTIVIDYDAYMDDRVISRLRFSVAHEIGHLVLHRDVLQDVAHGTVEEWLDFYSALPEDQYSFLEFHANEFAGRLLVPRDHLVAGVEEAKKLRQKMGGVSDPDLLKEYSATWLGKRFDVSSQVIARRFEKEAGIQF